MYDMATPMYCKQIYVFVEFFYLVTLFTYIYYASTVHGEVTTYSYFWHISLNSF